MQSLDEVIPEALTLLLRWWRRLRVDETQAAGREEKREGIEKESIWGSDQLHQRPSYRGATNFRKRITYCKLAIAFNKRFLRNERW
jgi:hypothetical protein